MLLTLQQTRNTLLTATMPGIVRVGHVRVSVYGFIAAAGVIAAIWLSQYTARLAGLPEQKLWDAGMFVMTAAFVVSRALLVVQDPAAFLHYPLLVLSLPSLTYAGMGLTAVATLVQLRRQRLPLLTTLDAWTAPAALLGAFLALGHFAEGTDAGMPTTLPWGVVSARNATLGRVQPVQLYLLMAAVFFCVTSLRLLQQRPGAGLIAARALLFGGIAFFLLDMLAEPAAVGGHALLDPGQYVALGGMALGFGLRARFLLMATPQPISTTITQEHV